MPSPTVMKLRHKQAEQKVTLSADERQRLRDEKKKDKEEEGSAVGPWILALLLFVTVGSAFLNIFQNIQNGVSMSEEH